MGIPNSALPCQKLTGTSITTRTQPFGELAQIILLSVCTRLCLCACVLSTYTQNLTVYNQPYKTVITVAYTSRRPTSWSRDSLTNNSKVQKILLFLRYWVVYLWFIQQRCQQLCVAPGQGRNCSAIPIMAAIARSLMFFFIYIENARNVELRNDLWIMNWNGCGRKWRWLNMRCNSAMCRGDQWISRR